jgi:secondary thiamine-phosphate synthase enzyme
MGGLPVDVRTQATEDLVVRDITRDVADTVRESGVRDGICCIYSAVTTCAVRVNELETGIVDDFTSLVTRLLNGSEPPPRTRARCLSMLFGPAGETIPVADGELCLGTWQRVLFVEFDGGRVGEARRWLAQVVGRPEVQTVRTG